jgi:hypothetical protein
MAVSNEMLSIRVWRVYLSIESKQCAYSSIVGKDEISKNLKVRADVEKGAG